MKDGQTSLCRSGASSAIVALQALHDSYPAAIGLHNPQSLLHTFELRTSRMTTIFHVAGAAATHRPALRPLLYGDVGTLQQTAS